MAYGINTPKKANGVDLGFIFRGCCLVARDHYCMLQLVGKERRHLVYAYKPQKIRFYVFSDLDTVLR